MYTQRFLKKLEEILMTRDNAVNCDVCVCVT